MPEKAICNQLQILRRRIDQKTKIKSEKDRMTIEAINTPKTRINLESNGLYKRIKSYNDLLNLIEQYCK